MPWRCTRPGPTRPGPATWPRRPVRWPSRSARSGCCAGCSPCGPLRPAQRLTAREVEVLGLLARGLSNREIGARLFISANTAANHIRSILMKTGAANRTQAARYATEHRLA
ncbi:MAG TPA: response regulator transcription factor [Pseudonocardia sp.]|nr:response regulator transcription factor [Pseudonocardia sp.]